MDLLLCEVIYCGQQKHLGRLKCRCGVLERLDQQDWSPVRGPMEAGQGKGGEGERRKTQRERKEEGTDRELRSRRMTGDVQGWDQTLLHGKSGY